MQRSLDLPMIRRLCSVVTSSGLISPRRSVKFESWFRHLGCFARYIVIDRANPSGTGESYFDQTYQSKPLSASSELVPSGSVWVICTTRQKLLKPTLVIYGLSTVVYRSFTPARSNLVLQLRQLAVTWRGKTDKQTLLAYQT